LFPSEVDKILKEKNNKGFLSISNLNPHIHPKDLLMSLHSRFFAEGSDNENEERNKKKKKNKSRI
jgi:hypothetical protein